MPSYILTLTALASVAVHAFPGAAATTTAAVSLQSCAAGLDGKLPSPTPPDFVFSGNVRRYYVAAEEVEWDYAPTGWDNWLGVPLNISPRANWAGANRYGTKWLKGLYRGYTDSTFTTYSEQPPWQGTQGPTIRSEVGDLIEIMFYNKLSKNYATMHSMGLEYDKSGGEGADYPNNTAPGENVVLGPSNATPPSGPGECVVLKWMVDALAGPDPGEPAAAHSYHSYVTFEQDQDAGLIGPQIVYAAGQMEKTMATYREFPLLYMIYNEADSWLSGENAARLGGGSGGSSSGGAGSSFGSFGKRSAQQGGQYGSQAGHGESFGPPQSTTSSASSAQSSSSSSSHGSSSGGSQGGSQGGGGQGYSVSATENLWPGNYTVWHPQIVNLAGAGQFMEGPSFYSMNGYIFGNNPSYEMCLNDKVIWYVNAYGSMSHVYHMHGNSFHYDGFNRFAISINDGEGKTLYMNATGQGKWQVLCHVAWHQTLGMVNSYEVYPPGQCPLPPLAS